ncbi:hypothetical protein K458DRAFT_382296 [Lentithecium fluviatile CBS 122367]|uniref:Uncharacterized protein n=1 Tax=Lentithecium fluviatile CBS 122367 TaxID=1168545 RepID=A0A6G1JJX0_9PLEO|nr:hypothetical protein K458DRAFT_382296 [Lentithecium fluviatile CBS 122367]
MTKHQGVSMRFIYQGRAAWGGLAAGHGPSSGLARFSLEPRASSRIRRCGVGSAHLLVAVVAWSLCHCCNVACIVCVVHVASIGVRADGYAPLLLLNLPHHAYSATTLQRSTRRPNPPAELTDRAEHPPVRCCAAPDAPGEAVG